jgi:hypothetical protein
MTDAIPLPDKLKVLRESWAELMHRLPAAIAPALDIGSDALEREHGRRFSEWATRECDALVDWTLRLVAWVNGPLAVTLDNPDVTGHEMGRVADRLSHFVDELIERRERLRGLAHEPAFAAAAPRIDAVYVSLLWQIQSFVANVVRALEPQALGPADGGRAGDVQVLSFEFTPTIDPEMSRFRAWMDGVRARWDDEHRLPDPTLESSSGHHESTGARIGTIALIAIAMAVAVFAPATGGVVLALVLLVLLIRWLRAALRDFQGG